MPDIIKYNILTATYLDASNYHLIWHIIDSFPACILVTLLCYYFDFFLGNHSGIKPKEKNSNAKKICITPSYETLLLKIAKKHITEELHFSFENCTIVTQISVVEKTPDASALPNDKYLLRILLTKKKRKWTKKDEEEKLTLQSLFGVPKLLQFVKIFV